jgi:hypothetical protein
VVFNLLKVVKCASLCFRLIRSTLSYQKPHRPHLHCSDLRTPLKSCHLNSIPNQNPSVLREVVWGLHLLDLRMWGQGRYFSKHMGRCSPNVSTDALDSSQAAVSSPATTASLCPQGQTIPSADCTMVGQAGEPGQAEGQGLHFRVSRILARTTPVLEGGWQGRHTQGSRLGRRGRGPLT